jgi:hypothetical protein
MAERDRPLKARFDICDFEDAEGLELGKVVTMVMKGKVTNLRGPEKGLSSPISTTGKKPGKEEEYTYPGSVEIEINSMAVKTESEFEAMVEEESNE